MHRADAASLDALHYAGQRWRESKTPLLLLLSTRAEALVTMKDVARWSADLERELHATTLELDALTLEETLQLVRATGEDAAHADYLEGFGRWLFSETSGQPFYITETLKALLERSLLSLRQQETGDWAIDFDAAVASGAWVSANEMFMPTSKILPHGVRDVIRARLEQVNPTAFALLVAGAVLGHDFTFEQMCQVAAIGENDGLPLLDQVLMHRLLNEDNGTRQAVAGSYIFTHDKIRDVVYTEAGEARRRVFHRRALEALQVTTAPAAELARHALAAGLTEAAFWWSVAAGDDAMKLFAVRDALSYYEQARGLLADQWRQGTRPENFSLLPIKHLYAQLGRAHELITDSEGARQIYEEMLALARQTGSTAIEQAALNRLLTMAAQNPYQTEQAKALLDQTVQAAERQGTGSETAVSIEEAETEWNRAELHVFRFEITAALEHGKRALAMARQLGQQELIARSLNVLGIALMVEGRWEESERSLEEAALLFRALGNRALEVDSLSQAATPKINRGRPHAAISEARAARTISSEIENAWSQVNTGIALGQGLLELGVYGEALRVVQEAVDLARAHSIYVPLSLGLVLLGMIHRATLNPDAARFAHLEVLGMVEPLDLRPMVEVSAEELCADCALAAASGTGRWDEAQAYALQALANRTEFFVASTRLALWYETEALVLAGEIDRATQDVKRYGERISTSRRYRIPYLRALTVLAKSRGEIEQAIEYLQEAAHLAEEIGLPGDLWLILAALGDLYLLQDNADQAHFAFTQATSVACRLADSIEDEKQRATFLSSQMIQHVLSPSL